MRLFVREIASKRRGHDVAAVASPLAVCFAVCLAVCLVVTAPARAASATTVVTATVPSATTLNTTACATNTPATSFGTVLPSTNNVTNVDCSVIFGSSNDTAMLFAKQTDGLGVAMWSPTDGSLDTSFGSSGVVTTDFGGDDTGDAVAAQADGKIVAGGDSDSGGNSNFAVARYNLDGSLDATFGTGGKVTTDFGYGNDYVESLAVQSDGKIVAAGYALNSMGNYDIAVARYTADGELDATFGTGGMVLVDGAGYDDYGFATAILSDGDIVVGGMTGNAFSNGFDVVRFTSSGALDTTFGTTGQVRDFWGSDDEAWAMALQSDGKIVLAGRAYNGTDYDVRLARYNTDGTLDTTFGTSGTVVTAWSADTFIHAVAVQSNGDIVVSGEIGDGVAGDFALARYTPDGTLDPTFGAGGKVTTDIAGNEDFAESITLQSDGRILAFGWSHSATDQGIALIRYNSDGAMDTTFGGGDGIVVLNSGATDDAYISTALPGGGIAIVGDTLVGAEHDFKIVALSAISVPDYWSQAPSPPTHPVTTDWASPGTNMFGVCLRAVAGGATTDGSTWAADPASSCAANDSTPWYALPTNPGGAKIAASPTTGTETAEADLRFGFRTLANQQPGTYEAPITFEVAAPNV